MTLRNPLRALDRHPLARQLWSRSTLRLYGTDKAGAGAAAPEIARDHWPHLERFEQTLPWLDRDGFLADCRRRQQEGILIFSFAEAAGPLLGFGYLGLDVPESTYTHVDQCVGWAAGTAVIYGGYVHPEARGRGLHTALQRARIHHAIGGRGMRWVISGIEGGNAAALRSAAAAGLWPLAELATDRRFGRVRKRAVLLDPQAPARFALEHR